MQRIPAIDAATAPGKTKALLPAVALRIGGPGPNAFHAAGCDQSIFVGALAGIAIAICSNNFNDIAQTETDCPHIGTELVRMA
jgi:hypothetical protein